jgi:hypothetical protein
MTAKKISLLDYAKQFERIECVACVLPERDEIDGAYRSGVLRKVILRWLWQERGYADKSTFDEDGKPRGISASMLDKHFIGQHHFKKDTTDTE